MATLNSSNPMVEVCAISKQYGTLVALDSVSLSIERGEIFGLIGADGAGKTSLIRIMATLLEPSSGSASVASYDCRQQLQHIRPIIGYMPGKFSLYEDLSIEENLKLFASIYGTSISESYDNIKDIYTQIEPFKKRRAGKLSGGMKQKLALCCALIHKPQVLFLDEPTTGVDPVSRADFWNILSRLQATGLTTIVSTPYMNEASLCDRIAFMDKGHVLDIASPCDMAAKYEGKLYSVTSSNIYELLKALKDTSLASSVHTFGDSLHLTLADETLVGSIKNYLHERGFGDATICQLEPSIEDYFMQITAQRRDYER